MSFFKTDSDSFRQPAVAHNAPSRPTNSDTTIYTPVAEPRPSSRRSQRSVPGFYKGAAILTGFTPLPPLVAVIYVALGHAILRSAHSGHFAYTPITSSARAAATGGTILALPLAILLYLLLFPTKQPDPDDFFDDDEYGGTSAVRYATYALCAALLLMLGTIAGALGTVCLPANNMLSASQAAEAGIVGAVVLCGVLAVLASFAFVLWQFLWPRKAD